MIVEEQRTNNRQDKEGGVSQKRRVERGEDGKEDSGIRLSLPVNTKLY